MKLSSVFSSVLNVLVLGSIASVGVYQMKTAEATQYVKSVSAKDKVCLQQNIFFEARNQSTLGQESVAWVTLNRMNSSKYPNSICGVVWQSKQFSWTHDGLSDKPSSNILEQKAWEKAGHIAEKVLFKYAMDHKDPTNGAIMYHADYVKPYWKAAYNEVSKIDNHIFYK